VFYSVRLQLLENATVGPVFDGAQPSPLYRTAVREQFGNEWVVPNDTVRASSRSGSRR